MPDTISAIATPPGIGGLAVIRISGKQAFEIADKCFIGKVRLIDAVSHTIHYGKFIFNEKLLDTITAAVFKAPNSYTGEDVVEISCHGGSIVANEINNALIDLGARLAEPGEFTKRAFLNGKLDLTQVEAVADIIHSVSIPGAQTAARQLEGGFTNRIKEIRKKLLDICSLIELELDFADEDIEFVKKEKLIEQISETRKFCNELAESFRSAEILRSGYFVGIAGYPNSGKSTLFNTLLKRSRAIVSEIPGTTRDYLEEMLYLNGIAIKLIDTAGLRPTDDIIEIEGIKMVESVLKQANLILVLNDIAISHEHSDSLFHQIQEKYPENYIILIYNKIDKLEELVDFDRIYKEEAKLYISAKKGYGLENLKQFIEMQAGNSTARINDILVNQRQAILLKQAANDLSNAEEAARANLENELISIDIRNAAKRLGEITGETWNEEVLNNIFSNFCIGK
ncbi:MAG: hypothetical protein QG635_1070 [Bacteroidota bacterium]|nr:hypothetical protein [Bacteroidota bacterium]